jgi:hypothetical protein
MRMKSLLTATFCVAALAGATGGAALAGESTGNFSTTGKVTPIKDPGVSQSICAFSGQNPEAFATGEDFEPGRTQSWGQGVRAGFASPSELKGGDPMPGTSCNGHTGYFAGGGGEG